MNELIKVQRIELTEKIIYDFLAEKSSGRNRELLILISKEETKNYLELKKITKRDVKPFNYKVWFYILLSYFFGITFGLKLMERINKKIHSSYSKLFEGYGLLLNYDVKRHECTLSGLNDEKINYAGSIVLGLNDALVELTGALVGFTLALGNSKLVAVTGLITGISASISMAAAEFLSSREEDIKKKNPIKSSIYTGVAYIITVILLIIPYFFMSNVFHALTSTLIIAIVIIAIFNFYYSVAKTLPFFKRFLQMVLISLFVAIISFLVGLFLNRYFLI